MTKAATNLPHGIARVDGRGAIEEFVLDNGLRVVLWQVPGTNAVHHEMIFRYGSRQSPAGKTGIAHGLEHVRFHGTKEDDPREGNSVEKTMWRVGAVCNASTTHDRVVFWQFLTPDRLRLAMEYESRAFRGMVLRTPEFVREVDVIVMEAIQRANNPHEALRQAVAATAFPNHPYGEPVIGQLADIQSYMIEDMMREYDTYLWPENAVLLIVGDFDRARVVSDIVELYGPIPRSPHGVPQVPNPPVPLPTAKKRVEVRRAVPSPVVRISYGIPSASHPDIYALGLAGRLLGSDSSPDSLLYQALIDTGMCSSCGAYADTALYDSSFEIMAECSAGVEPAQVEAAIEAVLADMAATPADAARLARIKAHNRMSTIVGNDSLRSRAQGLSMLYSCGWDWRDLERYDDRFDAVTAGDVMRVVGERLRPERSTVGVLVPDDTIEPVRPPKVPSRPPIPVVPGKRIALAPPVAPKPMTGRALRRNVSNTARRFLPNGLQVQVMHYPATEAVEFHASILAGSVYLPAALRSIAPITAQMLSLGSSQYDKVEFDRISKENGLFFGANSGTFTIDASGILPAANLARMLPLLADALMSPTFDVREFDLLQAMARQELLSADMNPGARANLAASRAIYPVGHPLYKATFAQGLAALDTLDATAPRTFHANTFGPESTILTIVGAVDPEVVIDQVEQSFGSWRGQHLQPIALPAVPDIAASTVIERIPGQQSATIVVGRGINLSRLDARRYYAFLIANQALGGGGLGARLNNELRDKRGLTYGANSAIGDCSYGVAPWAVNLQTAPVNIDSALAAVNEVLEDYRKNGIGADEFADTVGNLAGSTPLGLTSSSAIAKRLAIYGLLGLPISELDETVNHITAVTIRDVNDAIEEFIDPAKCVTVVAGTVS